jgi:VIT1/CCC1 family predicted Fe2+/Mn2+ transporter/rubrerythrin
MMDKKKQFITNLKKAWRDEMLSARNYRAVAEREQHPEKKAILLRMAEAEDRHADRWAVRLHELGVEVGTYHEPFIEKVRRSILLKSSSKEAAHMLEAGENQADALYEKMMILAESETDKQALLEAQHEENAHSKMLEEMSHPRIAQHPQSRLDRMLGREHWHVTAGGWIGQAIYGVNDGLGTAFGVVSGVAGATAVNSDFILLSGFAAAIASALSMGSGAYLATKSEREVYEAELEREKREIEEHPEEEQEEMELFYQLKGFSPNEAKQMAAKLAEQPDQFLKTLAHEELGLSEKSFPKQWTSAFSATISTAAGAIIPVLPFIFWSGMEALIISFIISTAAHFAVGASKVVVTGRSWLKSGTEMTLIGLGEAVATYLIGMLIAPMIG